MMMTLWWWHYDADIIPRHECHQEPSLVPVVKPVSVKLPQPEETCIIKQVVLPRVECQQVSAKWQTPDDDNSYSQVKERRCMLVPEVQDGPEIKIDKCSVEVRLSVDYQDSCYSQTTRLGTRPAVRWSCSCPDRNVPPRWSPPTSG